jgi:hypothetical protein
MKNISLTLRAVHPPILLIIATWLVLFWLGYEFPEYVKFLIIFFIAAIALILCKVSRKISYGNRVLISLTAGMLILSMLYSNLISIGISYLLGIFLTWVLKTDTKNRYMEYIRVYNKIKNIDLENRSLIRVLTEQRPAWCTREVAKAAFLKRGEVYYNFAKNHYRKKGYRFYNIFPDGGVKVWFNPKFWRRIGI